MTGVLYVGVVCHFVTFQQLIHVAMSELGWHVMTFNSVQCSETAYFLFFISSGMSPEQTSSKRNTSLLLLYDASLFTTCMALKRDVCFVFLLL